ncbi:hypothetical protein PAXRUDRAFT_15690 [Paxillus rubicundulus Ve08.2h10]|uniref:Unplaced genomic scaffold scaffold_1154, whole genome shotgun sequence n=1 Tax=Paxillus rubicundulus Ve08.2h10 TaxID=930991 RepID=A0A0D0DGZ4_9AGAM|nr:hypothetical protein PAXRUDRAFT_15690 [Paxillus rubicundulus Ve08.2h10]
MGNSISRHFIIQRLLPTNHAVGRKCKAASAPLDEPSSKHSNLQTLALLPILKVSLNAMGRKCKAVDAPLDEPPSKRSDPYTLTPETLLPIPELASNTTTFPQALKHKREDHAVETIPFKFVHLEDGKRSLASTTFPFPTHASGNVVIPALGTITDIQSPQAANIPAVYLFCYWGSISMAMTATVLAEVNTINLMPNSFEEAEEIRNSFMGYTAHSDELCLSISEI